MAKMWAGRTSGKTDRRADDFNSSIAVDKRMVMEDIRGSKAHAKMLGDCGIIAKSDAKKIISGLSGIEKDLKSGKLAIDPGAEDVHMFVEEVLTQRIGDAGKRLHTARSRNDQVTLDLRLHLLGEITEIKGLLADAVSVITDQASKNKSVIMPGYTHLQRAQAITFGQQLMAYAFMLLRDIGRLDDCAARMNESPIGCCALAGTTFPTDRQQEAHLLGFPAVVKNSLDGVSDRDYVIEMTAALSMIMMHLSRFAEELVLWSSLEFHFIEFSDAYTTGSSIMPQKKNPDMAELIRGKTGRVYGDLITLLTLMKGLPLAYNKDMQEDKEAVFDACDTVKGCLGILSPMLASMTVRADKMLLAAQEGFINATDLADYLVGKGMPFRAAYKISGQIVAQCLAEGWVLENMPIEAYRKHSSLIGEDVYEAVSLKQCVARRNSEGGTSPEQVASQIKYVRGKLRKLSGKQ